MSGRNVRALALGVLLAGFEGSRELPDWLAPRLRDGLAGVTLFGRNIDDGDPVGALPALTGQLRRDRPDLLVAIDEEGGDVTRLETYSGSMTLGAASLGVIDDVDVTRRSSALLAARLRSGGVNVNFAPVADLLSERDNPVVGSRSFSRHSEVAARHVAASVRGHLDAGIAPTAKHFPGHGGTVDDSHLVVPVVSVDAGVLRRRELVPFQAAIAAGVPMVMTGHLRVLAVDPDRPATLSPVIVTDLLRGDLDFDGVVVTDGMDMHAISRGVGRPEGTVQALLAGVDLICIGGDSVSAEAVEEIVAAVEVAVAEGRLPLERLAEVQARVAALARRFWLNSDPSPSPQADPVLRAAARKCLGVVGRPQSATVATVVELYSEPTIVAGEVAFGVGRHVADLLDSPVEVFRLEESSEIPVLGEGQVVVSVRASHLHPWQCEVVRRMRLSHPDLIVVDHGATAPPELLGERALIAHDTSAIAARAAADILLGRP